MTENNIPKKTSKLDDLIRAALDKQFQQMEAPLSPEQEKAMRDKFMANINRGRSLILNL
mgnify:FL=1